MNRIKRLGAEPRNILEVRVAGPEGLVSYVVQTPPRVLGWAQENTPASLAHLATPATLIQMLSTGRMLERI
jgi:hypothetical protein